jgi:hypothetical protein
MSARKRNRPLLLRVAKRIKSVQRFQLNMGVWGMMSVRKDICDTVACVAGWTVVEAFGHKNIEFPGAAEADFVAVSARRYEALREKLRLPKRQHAKDGKIIIDVPDVARQALGLTFNEANRLFYGPGTWPVDLRLMTEREGAVAYLEELAGPAPRRKRVATRVGIAAKSQNQKDARIGVASPKALDAHGTQAPAQEEPDLVLV